MEFPPYLWSTGWQTKAPNYSGTVYHNYNEFFSIILLGLIDAEYKCIWVDVGANGSTSYCAVFNNSKLFEALEIPLHYHLLKSFQRMTNPSLTSCLSMTPSP